MKKLFAFALVAALIFVPTAFAGEFPDRNERGVPSHYQIWSGARLEPSLQTSYTTLDSIDFGFTADAVRMCYPNPLSVTDVVYIRFNTTASNATSSMDAYTAPASTSGAFINGVPGTGAAMAALAMSGAGDGTDTSCTVIPVAARGVTVHVVSGGATIDVMGFKTR